jgi:soluble lytic murein transglycosylase-like protein
MAEIVVISAFIWFFFMTPSSGVAPNTTNPPIAVHQYQPSDITKARLSSYIKKSNPRITDTDVESIAYHIDEYASKEGVDPFLVAALIDRESSFQKQAVSKTGAKGLGQIKSFNFESLDISDPFDIKQNVGGTVRYLKELKTMWRDSMDHDRLVLASYYQGPNKTKKTQHQFASHVTRYVDDVLKKYHHLRNNNKGAY